MSAEKSRQALRKACGRQGCACPSQKKRATTKQSMRLAGKTCSRQKGPLEDLRERRVVGALFERIV